jgi:hypothetical protein
MKREILFMQIENFILFFAHPKATFNLKQVENWIISQYDGVRPDRNKFYDLRNSLLNFSTQVRDGLYIIDFHKAEKFLESKPDKLKEFKKSVVILK